MKPRILNIVGARPNFMKMAPLMDQFARRRDRFEAKLVHTGQHYDAQMSDVFFDELGLPKPDIHLGVGSGSHAVQTAKIMVEFEKVVEAEKPALVIVVGDVNSTMACSIVAAKAHVPVAHVEAGLRSFDRRMPEEINRVVTDSLSSYLFITEEDARQNLRREGVNDDKVFFVGNVMIDTLLKLLPKAQKLDTLKRFGLRKSEYALVTLHRPSNVDKREQFAGILGALETIQREIDVLFPIHPRSVARLKEFGLYEKVASWPRLKLTDPLGYLDFMNLMSQSKLVLTDSGGLQEETTVLGIPCLTLRENTERPITIHEGTNLLLGTDPKRIETEAKKILSGHAKQGRVPKFWDGKAAERIVEILAEKL
jgi:UDP-N-acetylglucosamine 2-epimerase (non-hydrolysing)